MKGVRFMSGDDITAIGIVLIITGVLLMGGAPTLLYFIMKKKIYNGKRR